MDRDSTSVGRLIMGYKANSLLAGVALLAFIFLRRQHQRDTAAREHGCQPPVKHQVREVFTGFDFQVAINTNVTCLFHWHRKYGKTFETRQMFGLPSIGTIAPKNLCVVHMAVNDFGIKPFRLPGME
ncbi:hypothetical protein HYALB_00012779 [Hymenoscyphus albidus]|uniref:Uncharacterized protein n=1 Tax=Hymenoscyphus albidus TaxID=595503 RepID=A0A9N9QAU0_9HELO|nr:hypothetical protein HYALB_00012779 [Hymenoscyphus albidus]